MINKIDIFFNNFIFNIIINSNNVILTYLIFNISLIVYIIKIKIIHNLF